MCWRGGIFRIPQMHNNCRILSQIFSKLDKSISQISIDTCVRRLRRCNTSCRRCTMPLLSTEIDFTRRGMYPRRRRRKMRELQRKRQTTVPQPHHKRMLLQLQNSSHQTHTAHRCHLEDRLSHPFVANSLAPFSTTPRVIFVCLTSPLRLPSHSMMMPKFHSTCHRISLFVHHHPHTTQLKKYSRLRLMARPSCARAEIARAGA
mmetsp:Transcript_9046/g.33353  ORF Transcript_9046/g.33353 Transcript_9046/m.33353 type:complete len:204 (+) Transcript_9046:1265-1876(+)